MKIYNTVEGVDEYTKMCEGYDNSSFRDLINQNLEKGKTLLELGMGPCNDYFWLKRDYKATGSDYSKEFIKRAQDRFPNDNFLELDALTIACPITFDAIYSCKVLQHFEFIQLEDSLKRQYEVLNSGGVIIHSFWVGNKTEDIDDMHFNYFDTKDLLKLISTKFEVLEYREYEEFEAKDSLFIIARKK